MAGVTERFRRAVLAALGWDRQPPPVDFMVIYPAKVTVAAGDGSTVDIEPLDNRIGRHQGVPVRTCLPGCTVVVKAETILGLGWEQGDPSKPYAAPIYQSAGGITKVVVKADMVYLGDEAGAKFVALADSVDAELGKISATLTSLAGASFATSYSQGPTKASKVKAV
jgi:hypothetical protein